MRSKAKALDLFVVAEQFRSAGKLAVLMPHLASTHPAFAFLRDWPNMPQPALVCSAFALELYLKCLIRMGGKTYRRRHDLVELFGLVGTRPKTKIKRYFRANSAEVREYVERSYTENNRPAPKVTSNIADP
jgi:hypothetical protein